jgi:nitrilase
MYLFDVDVPDQVTFEESRWITAGTEVSATATELGTLGLAVCYDLRFPELFRALVDQGTEVIVFPSAFAASTGSAHWEVLLRARAIEEQAFVIASNQYGQHTPNFTTYGHSMIVDPWGRVLGQAESDEDCIVTAQIDLELVAQVRRNLPALTHRRKT